MDSLAKQNYSTELRELNWDFRDSSEDRELSQAHWYPARFVPEIPGIFIGYFSEIGDVVLDPFCGSGTTLTESLRLSRNGVGIDVNPIATLITQAKLLKFTEARLAEYTISLQNRVSHYALQRELLTPNYNENRMWYHPETLHNLSAIWNAIGECDADMEVFGIATFSSILRTCSSQDRHWGWICDNVRPKTLTQKDAIGIFFRHLQRFGSRMVQLEIERQELAIGRDRPTMTVLTGTAANSLESISSNSVDLVVTSPPYYGVTDYVRSQRLTCLWLDLDVDQLKRKESGARYQRHRLDPLSSYMGDMAQSFREVARVLKSDALCCIVAGESSSRASYLGAFYQMLEEIGFVSEERILRSIPKRRSLNPSLISEEISVFRKIRGGDLD